MCSGSKTRDTCLLDIHQTAQSSAHYHNCHTLSTNDSISHTALSPKWLRSRESQCLCSLGPSPYFHSGPISLLNKIGIEIGTGYEAT